MKLSLLVLTPGKSDGKTIPITAPQFMIGRAPECQLRPASSLISKRHCVLAVRGGKVYLRDLDSTNGTFVNDQPIKDEIELHHDDNLKLGPLAFKVVLQLGSTAKKLTPTRPPRKRGEMMDEESVADLLLSLEDETVAGNEPGEDSDNNASAPDKAIDPTAETDTGETVFPRTAGGAAPPKKPIAADTSGAAKLILEKLMRRPRPT